MMASPDYRIFHPIPSREITLGRTSSNRSGAKLLLQIDSSPVSGVPAAKLFIFNGISE